MHIRIPAMLAAMLFAVSAPARAYAADPQLDDANAHLIKAEALVKASEGSGKGFAQHTARAEQLIEKAMREIDQAKTAADAQPPKPGMMKSPLTHNASGAVELNPQPEPPAPAQHH
jgi:hypothetical protein